MLCEICLENEFLAFFIRFWCIFICNYSSHFFIKKFKKKTNKQKTIKYLTHIHINTNYKKNKKKLLLNKKKKILIIYPSKKKKKKQQKKKINRINKLLFPQTLLDTLSTTNLLLIGVGGIGCEILKVLSQFHFSSIHILDLDTIEVSNLNRQFLFKKQHKGLYKVQVAQQVLTSLKPHMKILSYPNNIKEASFGL